GLNSIFYEHSARRQCRRSEVVFARRVHALRPLVRTGFQLARIVSLAKERIATVTCQHWLDKRATHPPPNLPACCFGFMEVDMDLQGNAVAAFEAPLLPRVEHALGVLRTYLVECATQDDWNEQRSAQLTEVVSACVRQMRNDAPAGRQLGDAARLSRR